MKYDTKTLNGKVINKIPNVRNVFLNAIGSKLVSDSNSRKKRMKFSKDNFPCPSKNAMPMAEMLG